jgi:hypothetical protein
LTCGAFFEVQARDGSKALQASAVPSFIAGDSTGGLWIVKKELASDAHLISRVVIPGLADGDAVTTVVWREAAVVVGTSSGKLIALDVGSGMCVHGHFEITCTASLTVVQCAVMGAGAPVVRGTLEVTDSVSGMCWDASAMDGIAMTIDGSIW